MECPICWEPLQSKAAVSAPCGHLFHEPCLERYVRQKVQEGFPSPDCPTCRAPIKQLTKENLRRIPLHLRGHVHGAIRRVYLASPEDADGDRCRELDHLWSRLEDMHNSLQENKEKRTAAEERAEGLAKALKQAQAKNKELQNELASLSSQQQSMSQPTKESIWGQDELSNHSRSNRELSAEQELQKWLDAALQPNIFQGSMHEREINQANAIAPYMSQAFTSGFHPGMLPVPQRPVPSSTYAYPQFFPMIPIVPPMSPGRFVAPPGSPLSNTRTQQPVPSSGEMHRPRSRGRALVGTARDRRVADIRYQHAHALLPGHRRNAAAAQGHAQHALAPPPFLQQPAMGATWIYPEGSA